MGRKKEPEKPENHERWLITYADLITLLMIFFIVLYTMAKVDKKKFSAMAQSLRHAIVETNGTSQNIVQINNGNSAVLLYNTGYSGKKDGEKAKIAKEREKLQKVKENLEKKLGAMNASQDIQVVVQERGIVIRIASKVLFNTGSADILPGAEKDLKAIANIIETLDNQIRIEGFTDGQPIVSSKYPSNWELSGARAFNVLKFITANSNINPDRLAGIGYGEFRPLDSTKTTRDRPEDRRVDIVVVQSNLAESTAPIQDSGTTTEKNITN